MADNPPTVLVIEDEAQIRRFLRATLTAHGYQLLEATTAKEGLVQAATRQPEIVILDLGLPDLDGLEVTRRLREWTTVPIIVLSARGQESDKVTALDAGADDYLTKPFSPRELVARVKAMLRRPRGSAAEAETPPVLHLGPLTIDQARHAIESRGSSIPLTPREFDLLVALAEQPGRVFTRSQLLERVWGAEYYDAHVVDVHVANLRRKLADESVQSHLIETVRGVGYRVAACPARGAERG